MTRAPTDEFASLDYSVLVHGRKNIFSGFSAYRQLTCQLRRRPRFARLNKQAVRRRADPGIGHTVDAAIKQIVHKTGRETNGY